MAEHKHWSEHLADQVIAEKKEPYVVTCGMTTSGPAHFGTVCEFLFPYSISQALKAKGKPAKAILVADILDAFDKIPLPLEQYTETLKPHMGKPLCNVPDPFGTSKSYGDHFLDEVRALMKKVGAQIEVIRANDMYTQGKFDEWALFFLKHENEAKDIIERSSQRKVPADFSVIMPICGACGKIATTRVLSHTHDSYEYSCDKDVKYTKGCGHKGKNYIKDHQYKLLWRLHWPAWKQILGTSIEGSGVDHMTRGGSEDTCKMVTEELMKKPHEIPYRYGFIFLEGKKYSKSKGIGLGVTELLELVPPEILKYLLLKPDLEENIDIVPTPESLLKAYEEYQNAKAFSQKEGELSRHERKAADAYLLARNNEWEATFLDMVLYYQVYTNWDMVARVLEDQKGVAYLKSYVENWFARGFVPETYRFEYKPKKAEGHAHEFFRRLEPNMDHQAVHNAIYEYAKSHALEPKDFFVMLYQALLGKERGPKLGKLITALGIERVKKEVL